MGKRVRVQIAPQHRDYALKEGFDIEPFDAEIAGASEWIAWHRVRPLSGRHTAVVDLPPMFDVWEVKAD